MYDLVIRNGKVIDGGGGAAYHADLAVQDGKIAEIGPAIGAGRREIDAEGLLVTPGWVDVHTHYDAQASWDPYLTPSSWHGVTTAVMGNCGVGFAPAAPDRHEWLIALMEGVEDIPGAALTEGIKWGWESFPEYLDVLEKMPRALDIGAQVPHGALRAYVMGDRGARNEAATTADIEAMAALVAEGIRAGALGFSTSRTEIHKSTDGEYVPGTFAARDELFGLGRAIKAGGWGVFQMTTNHRDMPQEFEWMDTLSREIELPVTFNLVQIDPAPQLWEQMLQRLDQADNPYLRAQVAGRPAGVLMHLDGTAHPFLFYPVYQEIVGLPFQERLVRLRDPEFRVRLLADTPIQRNEFETFITAGYHKMFRLGDPPDYEPAPETSAAAVAQASGKRPAEVALDWLLEDEGQGIIYFPFFNYTAGHMDPVRQMLLHPRATISLGDGGAHCGVICDSSIPTFMLTYWSRDRVRGPRLPLEAAIYGQTLATARLYGLQDRGWLKPGYKADINLIDYEHLTLPAPRMVYDLPAKGRRLIQKASGYRATIVSGEVILENGEATGAMPGKLLRGPQRAP
ncbi:MAG: amidohydrolase family protein [Candidatus Sericytochromatia bacterium]